MVPGTLVLEQKIIQLCLHCELKFLMAKLNLFLESPQVDGHRLRKFGSRGEQGNNKGDCM